MPVLEGGSMMRLSTQCSHCDAREEPLNRRNSASASLDTNTTNPFCGAPHCLPSTPCCLSMAVLSPVCHVVVHDHTFRHTQVHIVLVSSTNTLPSKIYRLV